MDTDDVELTLDLEPEPDPDPLAPEAESDPAAEEVLGDFIHSGQMTINGSTPEVVEEVTQYFPIYVPLAQVGQAAPAPAWNPAWATNRPPWVSYISLDDCRRGAGKQNSFQSGALMRDRLFFFLFLLILLDLGRKGLDG